MSVSPLCLTVLWLTCYSGMQDSSSTTAMRQRLVHKTPISRPAFTNDFEHSSQSSREGSVQIVVHRPNTFSVPSSDDELDSEDEAGEIQIASSVQNDEEEVSAATTPDHHAAAKTYNNTKDVYQGSEAGPAPGETRGSGIKGHTYSRDLLTKDGTSQENAINLEGVRTNVIEVDTESEDDGPDILPFHASSNAEQANRSRSWGEPQIAHQTSPVIVPTNMTAVKEQSDRDSEIQRHHVVPETQVNIMIDGEEARRHKLTSSLAETFAEAIDGFHSEDDDGFDYEHEFFGDDDLEQSPEPSVLNVEALHRPKPKVTFQVGNEEPYHTILTPPFDEFRPTRLGHLSVSDAINVSQPTEPSWAQRAPSPSDAALARKASDPKMILGRDTFNNRPLPQWPAVPKTTHSPSTEHGPDNVACREEQPGPYSWPELQSPEPRTYDQGPFSRQPRAVIPVPRSPKPDCVKNSKSQATDSWAHPYEENDDMIMDADRFARTGKQAYKITIPSLVENYLAENPNSFKRKYGEMNGSDDAEPVPNAIATELSSPARRTLSYKRNSEEGNFEEPSVGAYPQSPVEPTYLMWSSGEDNITQPQIGPVAQDTPLPDAQPRENIVQTPTVSVSQDSVAEPALGSVVTTKTVQEDDTEGPAPKKARTSSSSSGGIGKFVAGVGVGLLGVAAVFIATIPASVYEEALREVSNAV